MFLRRAFACLVFLAAGARGLNVATANSWTRHHRVKAWATPEGADLWSQVPDSLLKVGAKGAQPSHARSLADLLTAHALVKVKLSDHRVDVDDVAAVLSEADNAKLLEVHESKRYLLFGQQVPRAVAAKVPKADTRGDKVCRTCGERGHIAYDCPQKEVV